MGLLGQFHKTIKEKGIADIGGEKVATKPINGSLEAISAGSRADPGITGAEGDTMLAVHVGTAIDQNIDADKVVVAFFIDKVSEFAFDKVLISKGGADRIMNVAMALNGDILAGA